jgi:hypothetical protein
MLPFTTLTDHKTKLFYKIPYPIRCEFFVKCIVTMWTSELYRYVYCMYIDDVDTSTYICYVINVLPYKDIGDARGGWRKDPDVVIQTSSASNAGVFCRHLLIWPKILEMNFTLRAKYHSMLKAVEHAWTATLFNVLFLALTLARPNRIFHCIRC